MDNKGLCKKHGLTVHRVGAAYMCWPDGSPIPAVDLNKFLVATSADVFDEKLVDSIPLAETYDEAQAFAVRYLDLNSTRKTSTQIHKVHGQRLNVGRPCLSPGRRQ